jgi:hypothetical protein
VGFFVLVKGGEMKIRHLIELSKKIKKGFIVSSLFVSAFGVYREVAFVASHPLLLSERTHILLLVYLCMLVAAYGILNVKDSWMELSHDRIDPVTNNGFTRLVKIGQTLLLGVFILGVVLVALYQWPIFISYLCIAILFSLFYVRSITNLKMNEE